MEIILAKSAGYCFGVNKAVDTALDLSKKAKNTNIYTLGYLIHNTYVVEKLRKKGVYAIESLDEIDTAENATILIRSHGVGKDTYEEIKEKGFELIDATCPYVKSIQNKVEKYFKKGYTIIIVGDKNHPEVIGVNGWCENSANVIYSAKEAEEIKSENNICIVSQTTILQSLFEEVSNIVKNNNPNTVIFNTICNATTIRQEEASDISQKVDAMIVVGDKKSSNTKKLVEISKANNKNVFHVETCLDVDENIVKDYNKIGVTAGASTPTELIEEVIGKMEKETQSFEQDLENSIKQFRVGDIIEGEIIGVNHSEVVLSIGYKSDGIIKKSEYMHDLYDDLTTKAAKGDIIKVMVVAMNDGTGNVSLSKIKVDELEALKEVEVKFNNKETINGKINKIVKGGLIVDLEGIQGFMPASYYDVRFIKDFNALLGKSIQCRIIEFDMEKSRIVVSRRVLIEEEIEVRKAKEAEMRAEAIKDIEVGNTLTGAIKNITKFGMFIDLNGVDGFIHISDISWKKVNNIESIYKVGDEVSAVVLECDKETYKVKLSIKNTTKEPWSVFIENHSIGSIVDVEIKNITSFGAFAEILPDVEGLIHISQISHDRVDNIEEVVKTGDKLKAKIIEINKDKRKIGLSVKDLTEAPKRKIPKNKVFYKENEDFTLGDIFGDLLK